MNRRELLVAVVVHVQLQAGGLDLQKAVLL
jgi:hypothetical protein